MSELIYKILLGVVVIAMNVIRIHYMKRYGKWHNKEYELIQVAIYNLCKLLKVYTHVLPVVGEAYF
jgi:hypothetical protein